MIRQPTRQVPTLGRIYLAQPKRDRHGPRLQNRQQRRQAAWTWLAVLVFAASLLVVVPVGAAPPTLEESLASALVQAADANPAPAEAGNADEASSWLASVPTLSASYIDSQPARGTDEAEVSINLPIKSSARRRIDAELARSAEQYAAASTDYRRWVFAGRLREAVWDHELAKLALAAARERLRLLAELADRLTALAASNAIPQYTALITQRARIDAELSVDAAERRQASALQRFELLTGHSALPENITEPGVEHGAPDWSAHPALRQLELARAQQRSQLALARPDTSNWNVSLVARNFEGPQFSEEQYGLALEVPLNFLGTQSEGNRSARQTAMREYLLARDTLWLDLRERWNALTTEAARLERQRELLARAVDLADQIEAQIQSLEASNEIEAELRLQRLLDVVETRAALAQTDALIGRNHARLQQAAGRVF